MVAGGYRPSGRLSSTEIFATGSTAWTSAANLPFEINGLIGVSINNKVLMTG